MNDIPLLEFLRSHQVFDPVTQSVSFSGYPSKEVFKWFEAHGRKFTEEDLLQPYTAGLEKKDLDYILFLEEMLQRGNSVDKGPIAERFSDLSKVILAYYTNHFWEGPFLVYPISVNDQDELFFDHFVKHKGFGVTAEVAEIASKCSTLDLFRYYVKRSSSIDSSKKEGVNLNRIPNSEMFIPNAVTVLICKSGHRYADLNEPKPFETVFQSKLRTPMKDFAILDFLFENKAVVKENLIETVVQQLFPKKIVPQVHLFNTPHSPSMFVLSLTFDCLIRVFRMRGMISMTSQCR